MKSFKKYSNSKLLDKKQSKYNVTFTSMHYFWFRRETCMTYLWFKNAFKFITPYSKYNAEVEIKESNSTRKVQHIQFSLWMVSFSLKDRARREGKESLFLSQPQSEEAVFMVLMREPQTFILTGLQWMHKETFFKGNIIQICPNI